jgi:hypothetical protein
MILGGYGTAGIMRRTFEAGGGADRLIDRQRARPSLYKRERPDDVSGGAGMPRYRQRSSFNCATI